MEIFIPYLCNVYGGGGGGGGLVYTRAYTYLQDKRIKFLAVINREFQAHT